MAGHDHGDVDDILVFSVRTPEPPGLEIRINFGMFAGREVTAAEIQDLGAALLSEVGQVEISAETRYEIGPASEADVHQVRIAIPQATLPGDDFLIGELAGRLESIAGRWARASIDARHVEINEL